MVRVFYSLYDGMLSEKNLYQGYLGVKKAKGSAGIDGQTIADFGQALERNIATLAHELREKTYKPHPVLRKEILKPDGGVRKLGIPAVRDRIVQQTLLNILQPIFDPEFHPSSYGYRPGRSSHQAIAKATLFIRKHQMQWVVDMDLSKCFDTLNHGLIIQALRKRIADGSILNLVRLFLQGGVMEGQEWHETTVGSPQGGVISPLIANIYLDAFDQEMKRRGHRIVRYADDILILTRSQTAAENVMKQASRYLEEALKLTVNRDKTHIVHSKQGVDYLGVTIRTRTTSIQPRKIQAFKEKVKRITRRNSPVNLKQVIAELNPLLRGFFNYFRVANCKSVFKELIRWIRRRLRAKQMSLWKKATKLHRVLRQRGYRGDFKKIKMASWRNSACQQAHFALPNIHFEALGLFSLETFDVGISVPVV